jgi:glucose-6-phosphate isomerase
MLGDHCDSHFYPVSLTPGKAFDLRLAFAQDAERFSHFSQNAPYVFADLSKNLWDRETESLLLSLAKTCGLTQRRDDMYAGECVNLTEGRSVLHTLLRYPDQPLYAQMHEVLAQGLQEVHATLSAMLTFAEQVRADDAITDIVNIGIGGSDLGPQMVVQALEHLQHPGKCMHFVSNVDGQEIDSVLRKLNPESTLFLIASKTFTTAETMTNARSAKAWFEAQGGTDLSAHFVALTTNVPGAHTFGISRTFGFWDWVGGRYSIWSAIGLPIAIAIGEPGFRQLLAGAHEMDEHFRTAPLAQNLPVRLGLLDVWYRNFHQFASRCVAPYHAALRRFPAYLQQLEMESNGKRVDLDGHLLPYSTSPVLWGEPGTNGQHAFFQMLHQGTDIVPVEFIAVRQPAHQLPEHHPRLLANALAQAQALMTGRAAAGGHRHFPGNRPSTFLLLDELTPAALGALIALHEHRVFVSGCIWGINSFDQWGVELGKVLASDLEQRMKSGDLGGLDGSTAGLLARICVPAVKIPARKIKKPAKKPDKKKRTVKVASAVVVTATPAAPIAPAVASGPELAT